MRTLEIIVIDHASCDGTADMCQSMPDVFYIQAKQHMSLSQLRNEAASFARGQYIFFIDDDNVVSPDMLSQMVAFLEKYPNIGIAGPTMFYYEKKNIPWCMGAFLSKPFYQPFHISLKQVAKKYNKKDMILCDYIPNSYIMKRELFESISGFDEKNFPIAWEEIDLGMRIKKLGLGVAVYKKASIFHDCPYSSEFHLSEKRCYYRGRSKVIFFRKYCPWRLLLLGLDIVGFVSILMKASEPKKFTKILSYLKGMFQGMMIKNISPHVRFSRV